MAQQIDEKGRCPYCGNLGPNFHDLLPFSGWWSNMSTSQCHTCQIMTRALQKLHPQFVQRTIKRQIDGSHDNAEIHLSSHATGNVSIGVSKDGWTGLEARFQLYFPSTDTKRTQLPWIQAAGDIALTPGDESMWYFLQDCLTKCNNEHGRCKAAQDTTWYPKKLLYCTQDSAGDDVLQLIETKLHPPGSPYITLSYCRSSQHTCYTNMQNLSELCQRVVLSDLPRAFQDCISTARRLGVHYVWIDSMCIVQDDPEDCASHAQSMAEIFGNALFTVAAVSSPDSSVPFLGLDAPNSRKDWQGVHVDTDSNGSALTELKARDTHLFTSPHFIHGDLENSVWAWQERYFSMRTINFMKDEAKWQCKTCNRCECLGKTRSANIIAHRNLAITADATNKTIIRQWRNIVLDYARRSTIYDTDRLPALAGVASYFHKSLQSEYLAGIWSTDYPRGFAWYTRELSDCPTDKPRKQPSLNNGVPSWSWASVPPGRIDYIWHHFEVGTRDPEPPIGMQAELISISCSPSSSNVFGEVEVGSALCIRGQVVEAELEFDACGCACVRREGFRPQLVVLDCLIQPPSAYPIASENPERSELELADPESILRRVLSKDSPDSGTCDGKRFTGPVYCVVLFTTVQSGASHPYILVLSKTSEKRESYQRLGMGCSESGYSGPLYQNRRWWDIWKDWEELGQWEQWEDWFADGESRTLNIL